MTGEAEAESARLRWPCHLSAGVGGSTDDVGTAVLHLEISSTVVSDACLLLAVCHSKGEEWVQHAHCFTPLLRLHFSPSMRHKLGAISTYWPCFSSLGTWEANHPSTTLLTLSQSCSLSPAWICLHTHPSRFGSLSVGHAQTTSLAVHVLLQFQSQQILYVTDRSGKVTEGGKVRIGAERSRTPCHRGGLFLVS